MDRLMNGRVTPNSLRGPYQTEARPSKVRTWIQAIRRKIISVSVIAMTRLAYSASGARKLNRLPRRIAGLHFLCGDPLTFGLVFRATIDRL